MDWLEAIVLGVIQGLTEFLPVSSSGHLELTKYIFGNDKAPEASMLMTVVLHAATALSTIVVFRKDIAEILKGLFQFKWNDEFKFSLKIVISMIPAALVGVLLESELEQFFDQQIVFVGFMLIITAILLYFADKAKSTNKGVSYRNALIIGISQAVAILPGISRSGATISTSVLLGIDRTKSARFSFLMVVPLILGKMAKDLMSGEVFSSSIEMAPLSLGFLASFITGLLACTWMIQLVKNSKLTYFAIYCIIIGLIAIFVGLNIFRIRVIKEDYLNGQILLFDKDKEWTSFDLVNKTRNLLKKTFNIKKIKVGHAGTLDPLATGLMIVCTGKETKNIDNYQGLSKTYITTLKLGESTPSFDLETEIDKTLPYEHITKELVERTLKSFTGKLEQVPPMFSAINVNGQRAYQLARKGKTVELKKKNIEIFNIKILDFSLPYLKLEINCSKGTYIRSLARDIGEALETVAHLTELERTKIGDFCIENAKSIKDFESQLSGIN